LQGPGTFYEDLSVSYINVGNGSNAAQLIVNGATVNQQGLNATLGVASGSTLTVENGGAVKQTDGPGESMSIANLVVNGGTVSTDGFLSIGSATITNGATVLAIGGNYPQMQTILASGNVVVDDADLEANGAGSFTFTSNSTLTVEDGSEVNSYQALNLPGSTTITSGVVIAPELTFGNTLTMQLNLGPETVSAYGQTFTLDEEIGTGGPGNPSGVLNLEFPAGFVPAIGDEFGLFNWGGGVNSAFSQINTPALPAGESWDLSDIYTTGTVSIVPEPGSIGLLLAAGGLLLRRRRPKN
jgi:hypothetical protein